MVVGVSHHTTHMKLTLLVYFNNENDKMTIKKRCHDLRLVVLYLMYNLDVRAVGDDFMCCYHK